MKGYEDKGKLIMSILTFPFAALNMMLMNAALLHCSYLAMGAWYPPEGVTLSHGGNV